MKYLEPLVKSFKKAENPVKALQMHKYLKCLFPCLGIDTKKRENLQKEFFVEYGYPERIQLFPVVFALWEMPERDFQMCAIRLLQKYQKSLETGDIEHIERLIITKSWWDSVDGLAAWICGEYFKLYPERTAEITGRWIRSDSIWLKRSALLFQLKYKKSTDTMLLADYISALANEKEFFIRKVIGWILREYSKTNPDWVRNYISKQPLSALSYREAKKYL